MRVTTVSRPPKMNATRVIDLPAWITPAGIDLSRYPIDSILAQALSEQDSEFRAACSLLRSMCCAGRREAGVFLLGLLQVYPSNYDRLASIADALEYYPHPETVRVLASEFRRIPGSSATRAYLRRIITVFDRFPADLVLDQVHELSIDRNIGTRFRRHLQDLLYRKL